MNDGAYEDDVVDVVVGDEDDVEGDEDDVDAVEGDEDDVDAVEGDEDVVVDVLVGKGKGRGGEGGVKGTGVTKRSSNSIVLATRSRRTSRGRHCSSG